MMNLKEKFTSPVLYVGIGAMIVFLVKNFAQIDISKEMDDFLNILLPIIAIFTTVNNPDNKNAI